MLPEMCMVGVEASDVPSRMRWRLCEAGPSKHCWDHHEPNGQGWEGAGKVANMEDISQPSERRRRGNFQ